MEAGFPDGVLNVHGTNNTCCFEGPFWFSWQAAFPCKLYDIVDYICDDADVKAISFIGSDPAGLHIYARAAARGKRVQSNIGGKKHAIIMPDASIDDTLNALAAAGFGAAGKRCMALSTAVFVGGSSAWYF
ncbi:MALONATE-SEMIALDEHYDE DEHYDROGENASE [Salix koriyanagi]|uniref:MALONATE-SEMIALDEHYDE DEHYDROGENASE n=1 Tax=Salix koriyanagi TaxID=2511006 RepID=A0A9Q0P5B5_9ROSI|nr:MALONATE-SEMIALDEHYDE DEHYDROGENASE [Salix koriyanagi]